LAGVFARPLQAEVMLRRIAAEQESARHPREPLRPRLAAVSGGLSA